MSTALVVDDGKVDQRLAGRLLREKLGLSIVYADNGREALASIERQLPDVVVTDIMMPVMDGLELVEAIRREHPTMPVIMMTALGSEELAAEALQRGATSYVPKRRMMRDLAQVVERQFALGAEHHPQIIQECLDYVENRFVLDNDCSRIAPLVRYLKEELAEMKICDATNVMHVGVALEEAITNAIHHGNLCLDSELNERDPDAYAKLLEQRRHEPPYCDRRVHVTAKITRSDARYVIRDDGSGFDKSIIPDPTVPREAEQDRGRGLVLIHTVMDEVSYNETGSEITLLKRRSV
jgi:CheY-like chemotaxis protein/anti-sigma regulatory factor (Ser/Thr protein kinase)